MVLRIQAFRHCLERPGVDVDLSSGESMSGWLVCAKSKWQIWHSVVCPKTSTSCCAGPLPLTEKLSNERVHTMQVLLGKKPTASASRPSGRSTEFGAHGRTAPGNDTCQDNGKNERCSQRVVQGDQFQTACQSSICQSGQTSGVASWNTLMVLAVL